MQSVAVVVLLVFCGLVAGQTDLVTDPGLQSFSGNQCAGDRVWNFRSDYLWNNTEEFFDSRCSVFFELPTDAVPGLTRGNQTNINKAIIPKIPTVTGADPTYPSSAAVVDMNTPCRSSIWYPFTLETTGASTQLRLKLWVRSNANIQQVLSTNSAVPSATLLQYLASPNGLLVTTTTFPPIKEETNQIRIDFLVPDAQGSFYDRAFTLDPNHIAGKVQIPGFVNGEVTPAQGTNGAWLDVVVDVSSILDEAGSYALRVAGAQSRVGVSWGITDVHIETSGGTKKRNTKRNTESFALQEEEGPVKIVGTVTHKAGKRFRRK
jgi:hypothetical protein